MVVYVFLFGAGAVYNNVALYGNYRLEFSEKAYDNVFAVYFFFAVKQAKTWAGFKCVFYTCK